MRERDLVFISHVEEDEAIAMSLKAFLEQILLAVDVFVAGQDLRGGGVWIEHLREKLESAAAIISIITPYSQDASWVLFESGVGFVEQKTVPIVCDGITLGTLKSPLNQLHAREFNREGISLVVTDLCDKLQTRTPERMTGLDDCLDAVSEFFSIRNSPSPDSPDMAKKGAKKGARLNFR